MFSVFFSFCLHWVFVAACRLPLAAVNGGCSWLLCSGFSLWCLLPSGAWALGAQPSAVVTRGLWVQAQQWWCTGLAAPQHVESSWTRDQAYVPCTDRRILTHCATKEVPMNFPFIFFVHFQKFKSPFTNWVSFKYCKYYEVSVINISNVCH